MARPPKGKALTLRPVRLDDDVWAECKLLGHNDENSSVGDGPWLRWREYTLATETYVDPTNGRQESPEYWK